jgi:ABC-2 type transport system permease protein
VTVRGVALVLSVECAKVAAQIKARIGLVLCAAGPVAFAATMRLQSTRPEDTLFGRSVKESGYAVALVVLGFGTLWVVPVLASLVAGDIFSSEDRYRTWTTLLTRSRTRSEIFVGKALTAFGYCIVALAVLAASSIVSGVLMVGSQPLVTLSGAALPAATALDRTAAAWASALLPACALSAMAMLLSIATRSSAAGLGVPVVVALTMQLFALVDGPETARVLLVTSAFGGWHGLVSEPRYYGPLLRGSLVSAAYVVACLASAYRTTLRRDCAA